MSQRENPVANGVMKSDFNADGHKIVNLDTPTLDDDAATKKYVDDNAGVRPTDSQLDAMNSGVTAAKVAVYDGYAAAIAGKYTKPSTGIPAADLASSVQSSLGKADTALQPADLDDAVTRTSANGVKSSGIWAAIWGALTALPAGFSSLYDWCVAQLAGKVPTSRTVNSKALTNDVTIGDTDIPYTGYGSQYYSNVGAALNECSQVVASLPSPSDTLYTNSSGNVSKNGQTVSELNINFHPVAKLQDSASGVPNNIVAFNSDGDLTDSGIAKENVALKADLRYALTTKSIDNGAVTLDDRAINAVAVSSSLASLTVNFPAATSGKARDFGVRLTVASGITTAPQLVLPQGVVCENADGTAPEIGADGAATILYFTETSSGVFLVKGETVQTIS